MTTLLPPQDLATLRAVAKTAAVFLVALRIDAIYPGRAIADFEIADILEVKAHAVRAQFRSLSAAGLMLEQREKHYVVTPNGRNTLFGWAGQRQSLSIEEPESAIGFRVTLNEDLNEEDESINLTFNDSSSSFMNDRVNFPKTEKILQATHLLFGSAVATNATVLSRDPEAALCWVNKAYTDRATRENPKGLNNPQGLVFKRLMDGTRPNPYLVGDPMAGLPNVYLAAIGLEELREERPDGFCGLHMRPLPCPLCADEKEGDE